MKLLAETEAVLLSLLGGARYGAKIRFPHALVMRALFRSRDDTLGSVLRKVGQLTMEHTKNLATFAAVYKLVLALLKHLSRLSPSRKKLLGWLLPVVLVRRESVLEPVPPGFPEQPLHSFVAGAVGGYFVWGKYSSVNYQILLYLSSRVVLGLWKSAAIQLPQPLKGRSYQLCAALIWGTVMYLFEENPDVLQSSLKKSMDEIYRYQKGPTMSGI